MNIDEDCVSEIKIELEHSQSTDLNAISNEPKDLEKNEKPNQESFNAAHSTSNSGRDREKVVSDQVQCKNNKASLSESTLNEVKDEKKKSVQPKDKSKTASIGNNLKYFKMVLIISFLNSNS